jgi:Na+-translocating ferredoxin:NAD+ oxidoreductase RnfD subunit
MVDVIIGLAPAMIAAGYYFRLYAFILISTCVISAVATEWLCNLIRKKPNPLESLGDFSAVVTGIILALSIPPSLPVWAAVIGSAFSIAIGKMVFGGLGANIFNPAMVGRAFLTACFGMLMTTWTVPATVGFLFSVDAEFQSELDSGIIPEELCRGFVENDTALSEDARISVEKAGSNWLIADKDKKYCIRKELFSKKWLKLNIYKIGPQMPKISAENKLDARTQATPLAWSKQAQKASRKAATYDRAIAELQEKSETDPKAAAELLQSTDAYDKAKALAKTSIEAVDENLKGTFTGEVGGCLGETSALALLIGGVYLLIRRTISLHIPLAVMVSVFVFAGAAYLINPDAYASPVFHLCAGGLLIGAFFIATDPVTAPLSTKGMWIFGIGVGTITMLIRIVGEYPEGVMYSVLLMNAVTPLIDRFCKLVPAGGKPNV